MDTELRNRKAAGDDQHDPSASTGVSSANKHHHQPSSTVSSDSALTNDDLGTDQQNTGGGHNRVPSDELTRFPLGRRLTETQKENLVKESAKTAYGKTPNGTSKCIFFFPPLLLCFSTVGIFHAVFRCVLRGSVVLGCTVVLSPTCCVIHPNTPTAVVWLLAHMDTQEKGRKEKKIVRHMT